MRELHQKHKDSPETAAVKWKTGLLASLMIVGALFLLALTSNAGSDRSQGQPPVVQTDATGQAVGTPSPSPTELAENPEQTNGIVLAGVLLVLIIVGGTLSIIRRKTETQP